MTSISTSMSRAAMMSPNDRMKLQLQSAVSAGTVKASDQTALSSALDDIDTAIRSSGASQAGSAPTDMKTRVDSLIDKEVTDGKLSDEQASELKELFAQAAPQGPGGPPPPPPAEAGTDSTDAVTATSDGSTSTGTTGTSDAKQLAEALMAFLKKFQEAMDSNAPYAANGSSVSSSRSSVLFDATA